MSFRTRRGSRERRCRCSREWTGLLIRGGAARHTMDDNGRRDSWTIRRPRAIVYRRPVIGPSLAWRPALRSRERVRAVRVGQSPERAPVWSVSVKGQRVSRKCAPSPREDSSEKNKTKRMLSRGLRGKKSERGRGSAVNHGEDLRIYSGPNRRATNFSR